MKEKGNSEYRVLFIVRIIACVLLAIAIVISILLGVRSQRRSQARIDLHKNQIVLENSDIPSASNSNMTIKETEVNDDTEYIKDKAVECFLQIPDHAKVSNSAKAYMSESLFQVLQAAWNIPNWTDGEMGGGGFLCYFVSGNGGGVVTYEGIVSANITSIESQSCTVAINYKLKDEASPGFWDEICTTYLQMVKQDNDWILDDFSTGSEQFYRPSTKRECIDYINHEIHDYLSGETLRYMKSKQTKDWYTDEHINKVVNDFEIYIRQYQGLLNEIKKQREEN